jgi:hypothetical protein
MTDIYRPHIEALCRDEIEYMEFEERCCQAWIDENGLVPEGRMLVVGVLDHRLVVGHVEIQGPTDTSWAFKTLTVPLQEFDEVSK